MKKLFVISWAVLMISCSTANEPRASHANPYGLDIISSIDEYARQTAKNSGMELVDLQKALDGVILDIRYAGADNFTGEVIYTEAKAYARRPAAEALAGVQDSLARHGLGMKIFDAYRPYAATLKFYDVLPDTRFVADPRHGSRHNRGCAVDITLVDRATGKELPMPTAFDEFTERAHSRYMDLPAEIIQNRTFLFGVMAHFGFTPYDSEWWHFDFAGWENYPLMDLSFEQLKEQIR